MQLCVPQGTSWGPSESLIQLLIQCAPSFAGWHSREGLSAVPLAGLGDRGCAQLLRQLGFAVQRAAASLQTAGYRSGGQPPLLLLREHLCHPSVFAQTFDHMMAWRRGGHVWGMLLQLIYLAL